jgi:hypothetical protein
VLVADAADVTEDVLDLVFDHREDRPVVGVRPVEHEQVGESGGGDAEVGGCAVVPRLVDTGATAPDHVDRREVLRGREPGRHDDRVDHALAPVVGDDARRGDAHDVVSDELEVRFVERRVVRVRHERPLAAVGVRWTQLLAHRGVGDLVDRRVGRRDRQGQLLGVREQHPLVHRVLEFAAELDDRSGVRAERFELLLGVRGVGLRRDPVRGALEEVDHARLLADLRYELHRGSGGADHRDALAGEVVVPVPLRGVEHRAGEGVEAIDVGPRKVVEHADGAHDDVCDDGAAIVERESPGGRRLVPHGAPHAVAQMDVGEQAVLLGDVLHVGEDLGLGAVGLRPVGLDLERERVQRRLHVALAPGIAVEVPRAADPGGLLEQDEVVDPVVEQAFAHAQTARSGADDGDVDTALTWCAHGDPLSSREPPRDGVLRTLE